MSRPTPVRRLLAASLAAGLLAASVVGTALAADTAKVRVLHASPDAPAVDVHLDGAIVEALTNVPFGTISGYLDIPAGDHDIKVYATGTTTEPVIDADVTVAADAAYTIAATGALDSIGAQVLQDRPDPDCDTASVRVVHLSADAPEVDVAPAGAAPEDAVVKGLAFPDATDYLALPAGTYDLEVRLAGTTTVALALPGVAVEDCVAYSVFVIGSAATPPVGEQALQAVVAVDAEAKPAGESSAPAATPPATDTIPVEATPSDGGGAGWMAIALGLLSAVVVAARPIRRRQADQG